MEVKRDKAMMQEAVERRSEFRFPFVVPVEYFPPEGSGVLTYALDLSKSGTFISSDNHPLSIGTTFSIHLNMPVDKEIFKIFRTQGTVVWNRMQPFKSKRNGMGVRFVGPLPENLILNVLASNVKKLIKETEAKETLEVRVKKLESELGKVERLVALGRSAEKILFELSNPILTLSGNLEMIKTSLHEHKKMLEERKGTNKEELKKMITEFDKSCDQINKILKNYKIISELVRIVRDDGESLDRKLQRYNC